MLNAALSSAIFIDKDGTLIENVPYNVDPHKIRLCEGAIEGLKLLQSVNHQLIVITNQSGIARGYFAESALDVVETRLQELLQPHHLRLDGFYYCPHHPSGTVAPYAIDCQCRKPRPGLLYQAAQEQAIDLAQSWFIGDILNDIEAGRAAGCRTILIDNGNETEWELSPQRLPHHLAANLHEAAQIITAIHHRQHSKFIPSSILMETPVL
jgi:D-glycero-D-manno-heptose 1,7-bisphosphate phosphatase